MVEIAGHAPARFAGVKDAFAANFDAGEELGARFTLVEAGETVLDLWAGYADRARSRAFDERTLTPIFSTTKALAALLIARASSMRASSTTPRQSPPSGRNSPRLARPPSPSSRRCRIRRGFRVSRTPWSPRCGSTGMRSARSWRRWRRCGRRGRPAATTRSPSAIWPARSSGGSMGARWDRRCARICRSRSASTSGSAFRKASSAAWPSCSGRTPCRTSAIGTQRRRPPS